MLDGLQKWMKEHGLSPVMALATMNVVLIVAFFIVLLLLVQSQSAPVSLTPQVVILPNGDTAVPSPVAPSAVPQDVQGVAVVISTPTAGPSPTAPSNPFDVGGTIVMALRRNSRTHLYSLVPGRTQLTRLTAGPWDDRDPAWSPNGRQVAFTSNRSGGWDLHLLDVVSGNVTRLTDAPGFEANPSWSPDGAYLVYESYADDNFDLYIVSAAGGASIRVTRHPAYDFAPAWSPNGRSIAFVSYRDGGVYPDLYTFNLDEPDESRSVARLTDTAEVAEDEPQWSRDGQLVLYSDAASPLNIVYTKLATAPGASAVEAAQGDFPTWTPDGTGIVTTFNQNNREFVAAAALGAWSAAPVAVPVEGQLHAITWSYAALPERLQGSIAEAAAAEESPPWLEQISNPNPGDPRYAMIQLPDLRAPFPAFNDRVDEAFSGLRLRLITEAGWDFLAVLDNAAIRPDQQLGPGLSYESWNKAGRAFDISQAAINDGWGVLMREEIGNRIYWRLWVRVKQSDGSLGEPLRRVPWDFRTRFSGDPVAYDNGGSYFTEVPRGYFVDFTTLAEDFGWQRVPATDDWRFFYPGVQFWHYELRQGLTWESAMLEVWPAEAVATATPFQTPTFTPSPTLSPTATSLPTETDTPTATVTRTPTNTFTPTITNTATTAPTRLGLPSLTPSATRTATRTATITPSVTPSRTPSPSRTPTPSRTP